MASLSDLQTWKAALQKARFSGVLTVRSADGETVTYRSDADLAAALAEVDRQIAVINGSGVRAIYPIQSRGV